MVARDASSTSDIDVNSSRILRGHPAGWALLAAALLIGGYTNLWQGGTSVGATLLVVGYLLFVPLAIMRWIGDESGLCA